MSKTNAGYVDGFVLVVPKRKLAAYRKMAAAAGKVWRRYGALDYKECLGDDLRPEMGGMQASSFPKLTGLKRGETVFFSYIVYRSRAHRDAVNAKVMKDPLMGDPKNKNKPMPFDMRRFAWGGFKVVVDA
jgi:alkaline phosphatase